MTLTVEGIIRDMRQYLAALPERAALTAHTVDTSSVLDSLPALPAEVES